jgi:hypothetical protein
MAGSLEAFKVWSSEEKPDRVVASKQALEDYERRKAREAKEAEGKSQLAPTTTIEQIKKDDKKE